MQETAGGVELLACRYLVMQFLIFQMQVCVAGDWRVGAHPRVQGACP